MAATSSVIGDKADQALPDTGLPKSVNGLSESADLHRLLNQTISEADYWENFYDYPDARFEWNNGQLEMVPMTDYVKFITYLWFVDLLRDYLHGHPIARIIGLDTGFRLTLPTKTTIRKPDLGLVLHANPVPLGDHDRSYRGTFDWVLESLSDSRQSEIDRDAIIKRDEYALAGVREYHLLDERGIETQFYRLSSRGVYEPLPRAEGVIRSEVLPGFQFRVQDLYDRPSPRQMLDDPTYQHFVSPLLREERMRAAHAEARADEEKARADEERARAERYAALLRTAGILPE